MMRFLNCLTSMLSSGSILPQSDTPMLCCFQATDSVCRSYVGRRKSTIREREGVPLTARQRSMSMSQSVATKSRGVFESLLYRSVRCGRRRFSLSLALLMVEGYIELNTQYSATVGMSLSRKMASVRRPYQ